MHCVKALNPSPGLFKPGIHELHGTQKAKSPILRIGLFTELLMPAAGFELAT
jgi:hypothetical protein